MRRMGRGLLWAGLVLSGAALLARAWVGPYRFLLSVQSPMNAASWFAVAVVLLVLTRGRGGTVPVSPRPRSLDLAAGAALAVVTFAAYAPSLGAPFIADDYVHITTVRGAGPAFLQDLATQPLDGRFFRPVGMITYWMEVQWAGTSEWRWRLGGVALHVTVSVLVALFALQLGLPPWAAWVGALWFALHGARPEAVWWVAARFDPWAALLSLGSLLAFLRHLRAGRDRPLWVAAGLAFLAMLCKEAAFPLPLLAGLLLLRERRRKAWLPDAWRPVWPLMLAALMAFLWRWMVLGGIGGYRSKATGDPTVLQLDAWRAVKALVLRQGAALWVPLNWSDEPGPLLAALLGASLLAWAASAAFSRAARRDTAWALAFLLVAALPVQHLLLIGPDLEKSRFLYLPSVGLALFAAWLLAGTPRRIALPAAAALLAFQAGALQHNLRQCMRVAETAAESCAAAARAIRAGQTTIAPAPNVVDGVYFLYTGLPQCLEMRHGIRPDQYSLLPSSEEAGSAALQWDDRTGRLLVP